MLFYNKKIGNFKNYYKNTFILCFKSYYDSRTKIYHRNIKHCILSYPILYKKISFFRFSCNVKRKRNMKHFYNLNQTIILEAYISREKCVFSVPVVSFINKTEVYK